MPESSRRGEKRRKFGRVERGRDGDEANRGWEDFMAQGFSAVGAKLL